MLDMNVGKKPESLYFLGYLLELIIKIWQFEFSSSKSGQFRPIFQWNILCTTCWNFAKFRLIKNTESSINIFTQIWHYSNYKSKKPFIFLTKWPKTLLKNQCYRVATHLLPCPLNVKVEQIGPLDSVILSFSDIYIPVLQIWSGQ